jgi:hypothetical protein
LSPAIGAVEKSLLIPANKALTIKLLAMCTPPNDGGHISLPGSPTPTPAASPAGDLPGQPDEATDVSPPPASNADAAALSKKRPNRASHAARALNARGTYPVG